MATGDVVDEVLIQVLTMGRVGSSTVQRSLEKRTGRNVRHIHSINPFLLSTQVAKAGSTNKAARSVQEGLAAVAQLIQHQSTVKTVTLVRDSIARNLSAVFAQLRKSHPQLQQIDEFLTEPGRVREMWLKFYDKRPYNWFDNELRDVLGIDVFLHPFPDRGIVTIKKGRHEVLIMRSELDDTAKSQALENFVGVSGLPLYTQNDHSRTSDYSSRYAKFRQSIALEESYVKAVAQTTYTRHFYAAWAIEDYVDYWIRQTRPNSSGG